MAAAFTCLPVPRGTGSNYGVRYGGNRKREGQSAKFHFAAILDRLAWQARRH
jgi:hypothetical protein